MVTTDDIVKMLRNDLSLDIMGNSDDDDTAQIINTAIEDGQNEIKILDEFIPDEAKDGYVKILAICGLIDRLGINREAFSGYFEKEKHIRQMIEKIVFERAMGTKGKSKNSIGFVDSDINYIDDNFIAGFES